MKTYKEISNDIRGVLSSEITGTQLDLMVGMLSMYAYNIQANAVSQLLENNLDTAINTNSIIAKAAQYGVSVPRVTNPEVEFQVKSTGSSHTLYPGDEVISIGKFKFLYIGYYDQNNKFSETQCTIYPNVDTLIKCMVTDKVTNIEVTQIPGVIYDESISHVASKIFAYKDGQLMSLYDSYSDYLTDSGLNKLMAVTYPDYGVKLRDLNDGDQSQYRVILPNELTSISELIQVINTKASSKYVTVSEYRRGSGTEYNIKLVNLGSEILDRESTVQYVEANLKLTQLIKSNSDISAFFSSYLFKLTGIRYNISFKLGQELKVYVDDMYFTVLNLDDLIPRFYIGLNAINVYPGVELDAKVRIKLNNLVDSDLDSTISGYVNAYDGKFNTLLDEYDLIYKINSINPLIHITEFEIQYKAVVKYGNSYYTVNLKSKDYDEDVENLDFDTAGIEPDINKTYRLYTGKDKYLKTSVEWI